MNKRELNFCEEVASANDIKTTESYDIVTGEYRLFAINDNCVAIGEYTIENANDSSEPLVKLLEFSKCE